jgi:hypothetical protein
MVLEQYLEVLVVQVVLEGRVVLVVPEDLAVLEVEAAAAEVVVDFILLRPILHQYFIKVVAAAMATPTQIKTIRHLVRETHQAVLVVLADPQEIVVHQEELED